MSAREANRKSQKLFPLVNMAEKHVDVPIHLDIDLNLWNKFGSIKENEAVRYLGSFQREREREI